MTFFFKNLNFDNLQLWADVAGNDFTDTSVFLGTVAFVLLLRFRASSSLRRRAVPPPTLRHTLSCTSVVTCSCSADLKPQAMQCGAYAYRLPATTCYRDQASTSALWWGEGNTLHLVMFATRSLTHSSTACCVMPVRSGLDANGHLCCGCFHYNLWLKML